MGERRILVGKIGAAHGLKGEVKVRSFTEDPTGITGYGPLYVEGLEQALLIKSARAAGDSLIIRFEGIDDRTKAEELRGKSLYVARAQLPPLETGVYYQADLIGLEVAVSEKRLGRVVQLVNFGGGDLLEVETDGGERLLVPFTGAKVDLTGRVIAVDLPEGFLDEP